MISEHTIERVKEQANIVEVIGKYVDLKKAGSCFKGKSPFAEEKTASFMVSPSKGIYKCFSSGKGGGLVKFVMEKENISFPEAIELLAKDLNIEVEWEGEYDREKYLKEKKEELDNKELMKFAGDFYQKTLGSDKESAAYKEVYKHRRLSTEEVIQWGIGYCPSGNLLRSLLVENGLAKQGEELFLVGENWDNYQNRVIYPIHNKHGEVVGLAGRTLDDKSKYAKWINPKNGSLYNKDKILYGLYYAAEKIQKIGKAYLVEGYNDVIAMHRYGVENTVASCGTNITENQIKLLKRYCKEICIVGDNDSKPLWDEKCPYTEGDQICYNDEIWECLNIALNILPYGNPENWKLIGTNKNPGLKATLKQIDLFLTHGFDVTVALLPSGEDPDSFTRSKHMKEALKMGFSNWIEDKEVDAIHFKGELLLSKKSSPKEQADAVNDVVNTLARVQDDFLRDVHLTKICKSYKLSTPIIKRKVKEVTEELANSTDKYKSGISKKQQDSWSKIPKGVDREAILKHGFYGISKHGDENTGYWFRSSAEGDFKQLSNFIIKPLFHKPSNEDNTRVAKIISDREEIYIEMPSKAFVSVDQFRVFLYEKGAFFFEGEKAHLTKINKRYLHDYIKAWELTTLGWQNEGFFAYYNAAYNGKIKSYNEAGLFEHNEKNYFSPASSEIYSDLRKEDDEYENDRFLEYCPEIISFGKWAQLMEKVYGDHAKACVPFALVALFRDIVFKVDKNSPHLYFYGQAKSGKSKAGESVSALFFKGMPAFNLNSGTDFAFAARYSRFKNCPVVFNEFDDTEIKPEWFQALKGAYDGEGRERGKGGSKKKTETQKVHSSIILLGQYLSTKDDNSILSRTIMRSFKLIQNRPQKQIDAYNILKELEDKGLSGTLIKLLEHREYVEKNYYTEFNKKFKALNTTLKKQKRKVEERVLRNYSAMATLYSMLENKINDLPWISKEYDQWVMKEIASLSSLITSSDILITFWNTVELLFTKGEIAKGIHFKVTHNVKDVRYTVNGEDKHMSFDKSKSILHMRLRLVQQIYAKETKQQGQNVLNEQSLRTYLKNKDYYLGSVGSEKFSTTSSSAYIFDYSGLDISLVNDITTAADKINNKPVEDLPLPNEA
jgi:DNA primase catalytic core